eukprot:tig00021036_g17317.t2
MLAGLMVRVLGVAAEADCELAASSSGGQRLRGTCARVSAEAAGLGDIFEHLEMDYYERSRSSKRAPHAARKRPASEGSATDAHGGGGDEDDDAAQSEFDARDLLRLGLTSVYV